MHKDCQLSSQIGLGKDVPPPSLVPRLFVGGGKEEPGVRRPHMHLINFLWTTCIRVGVDK